MSTKPLMLEGVLGKSSESGDDEGLLRKFRKEKQQLEDELRVTHQELDDVRAEKERLERSVRNLRNQLSPLHRGLRALFGEIELAVGEEEMVANGASVSATPQSSGGDPRWLSFKQNFPGAPARIIDALLSHREMTVTQLSKLLKMDYSTAKGAVLKLRQAGAVSKETERGGPVRLAT